VSQTRTVRAGTSDPPVTRPRRHRRDDQRSLEHRHLDLDVGLQTDFGRKGTGNPQGQAIAPLLDERLHAVPPLERIYNEDINGRGRSQGTKQILRGMGLRGARLPPAIAMKRNGNML